MARIPLKYCAACDGKRSYRNETQARDGLSRILRLRAPKNRDVAFSIYRCPVDPRLYHLGHDIKVLNALRKYKK